jgi:hypothetical protein
MSAARAAIRLGGDHDCRIAAAGKLDGIDSVEDSNTSSFCIKPTRQVYDWYVITTSPPGISAPNPKRHSRQDLIPALRQGAQRTNPQAVAQDGIFLIAP